MYYALLGVILYAFFLSIVTKKSVQMTELLGLFVLTFLTFIIGLRYGVGIDYYSYEHSFNFRFEMFTYEPLYSLLVYIVKIYFDKFHYLTFIMILITNVFIYAGLKKKNVSGIYLILAIFIYSSSMALIFMNLMRQGVAVGIFFYASTFIRERNFKKYFLYILLGAGFHLSILFLLPIYFIKKIKFSQTSYLISVVASYILVYTLAAPKALNYIAYRLPGYSTYYNNSYIFKEDVSLLAYGVLLNVSFIFTLLLFTKDKKLRYNQEINYYLIGTLINILALSSFIFDRIGIYFFIFGIVAIPKMIENIKSRKLRIIFFILAVIVATSFYAQALFVNPGGSNLEYKSIFSLP